MTRISSTVLFTLLLLYSYSQQKSYSKVNIDGIEYFVYPFLYSNTDEMIFPTSDSLSEGNWVAYYCTEKSDSTRKGMTMQIQNGKLNGFSTQFLCLKPKFV